MHNELLKMISVVHAEPRLISSDVAYQFAEDNGAKPLTPKETEVLRLIAAGSANKEIAARLSITQETVKSRVKSIFHKFSASNRTHAVIIGLKLGILEL
jgi:DNA-binding NarL/FixJ family response regulator